MRGWYGVGGTSPRVFPSKAGDNPTEPELNHVQSTIRGTSSYGSLSQDQEHQVKEPNKSFSKEGEDTADTGPSLGESASTSDMESAEEEGGGNRQSHP